MIGSFSHKVKTAKTNIQDYSTKMKEKCFICKLAEYKMCVQNLAKDCQKCSAVMEGFHQIPNVVMDVFHYVLDDALHAASQPLNSLA